MAIDPSDIDVEALRERYRIEKEKRVRPDGNKQFKELKGEYAEFDRDPYAEPGFTASRSSRRPRSSSSAAASPACSPPSTSPSSASATSASSRRPATSAAPGTGTATRAACATSSRTPTSRCSRRPATCPPRATPGAGDLRVLQAARPHVRPLRARPVPDRDQRRRVGRRRPPLGRHHRPGRHHPGPLRGRGRRHPPQGQAARHPRHRDLPGQGLPHQPLGLRLHRRQPHRARWTSSATSVVGIIGTGATAVQAVPQLANVGQGGLRLPAHPVRGRRAQQRARPTRSGSRA